ncbi:hypothetical protein BJ322DRAFT_1108946 [Thelephora terrestris]|uniref:Uncharacterized protein n=1 Tax=Thelephora terrestris TaxID=56493 RepID=A0A9P6HHL1_9AGAM|nr:hypothetical protein BJ322DRAFT_1108946 [Thelephora terrestris]
MDVLDDNSLGLAGLDALDFLQFEDSLSTSASSSLTAHCHSSGATPTYMKDFRGSQKYQQSSPATTEDLPSTSSSYSSNIFKPLPPVPKVSSFHFSVIWDLHANSTFVADVSPPIPTQKSSNSSIDATDGNHVDIGAGVTEVPESSSSSSRIIYVSTDPYSPWPSPIRRRFMSRSDGSFSRISRYSRPESRSGARAPDPPSRRTSLYTTGCNIPGVRRIRRFTRNVRLFTQRMYALKAMLRKVHCRRPVIAPTPATSLPRRTSARVSRSSIASFVQSRSLRTSISSALTNSLQRWLEARNQVTYEKASDHVSITISQYERRGSWLTDDWCGIQHCDAHSSLPRASRKSTADRSIASIHTEPLEGKYVSVSLRAGEEASRRRKRSSDRTLTWSDLEFDSDS